MHFISFEIRMKKSRLGSEGFFDFDLIGVVSTVKEYKLAWYINTLADIELEKMKDGIIEFAGSEIIAISFFRFRTEHRMVQLIRNKLASSPNRKYQYLLPELHQFDFFLKHKDETGHISVQDVLSLLKGCPVVEYAAELETSLIKSKDNLIF
jgi:hypothetical protein